MRLKTRKQGNSLTLTVPSSFNIPENTTVEPEMTEEGILYRFVKEEEDSNDFDVLILQDLVEEGWSGEYLVDEFKKRKKKVPQAIRNMINEAAEKGCSMTREELEKEIGL